MPFRSTVALGRRLFAVMAPLLLAGCGAPASSASRLLQQCLHVAGQGETTLTLTTRQPGRLLLTLEEHGLSVSAHMDGSPEASSPVARIGAIALVSGNTVSQTHTLHVRTEDDRDLAGEVCATAEIIPASSVVRLQAEHALATAGQAVHREDWAAAFERYLAAARRYDELGLRRRAAQARQAMAELAYRRFDRKRDSYALASMAIEGFGGGVDPVYPGALLALQAKALLDTPGQDPKSIAPEIRERLAAARRYQLRSSLGKRERVRLDTIEGQLEYVLDAPDRASSIFTAVASSCRDMHDWDCYGVATQNLAVIAEEGNNYASALAAYADALHYLSPQLEPKLVAVITNNMGRLQAAVGLLSSSQSSQESALRQYAQLGDCPGARRTLAYLGALQVQTGALGDAQGDLDRAASLSCQALLAAVQPGPPAGLPARPGTRGSLEAHAARLNLCRHPLEPAALASDNRVTIFDALLSLSDAFMLEGESGRARRCLGAAQPYASTARARMRLANAQGELLLEDNDASAARDAFGRSLIIADAAKIPAAYEHRGFAQLGMLKSELLAGNGPQLLPRAYEALRSSMARGDIDQTVISLRVLAAAHRQANDFAAAAHTLQVAVDLVEAVPIDELDGARRATYLATQHAVFTELTDLFAARSSQDDTLAWQAFSVSERGRARSLRYAVSQTTQAATDRPAVPPADRYRRLLRQVTLTGNSAGEEHVLAALASASHPEGAGGTPVDRLRLMQTLAKLDATLVEYAAGSRDMFAFTLGTDGLHVVRLGDRGEIADAAAELRERLQDGETPTASLQAAAQRVARLVLWPIRARLTTPRLIFVPEDALHTIPFAVLPWADGSKSDLVLQHAEATTAPSALFLTSVHLTGSAMDPAPRIALLGDPLFRVSAWRRECVERQAAGAQVQASSDRAADDWTESLPSLPGTRTEVSMVARLARQTRPASHVETLLGCAAVANALRSAANGGADLLHIATHARVDAERPRLSALALTPDPQASEPTATFGLLDILGLKLRSRLVVLSACDTSRGRLLPGEGVLGPAQAFLQAGSAAVLASYWRVDDAATASFMQRFYTHLFAEHQPAATALRSAQLETARISSSPHAWAAFALYGWPDSSI